MKKTLYPILAAFCLLASTTQCKVQKAVQMSGNPVFEGRYADPEAVVFDGQYWIYPTCSEPFKDQLHFDAFSSPDLVNWTKHTNILSDKQISWLRLALWAPSAVKKDGKYYLFLHRCGYSSEEFNKVCNVLSEYAKQVHFTNATEAFFKEHFRPVIEKFALQTLSDL